MDLSGNLFIADNGNDRIRMVDTNGIITTVGRQRDQWLFRRRGPATNASFNAPIGIAVDASDNVFIADTGSSFPDTGNRCVRQVSSNGTITTVAGDGYIEVSGDGGQATNAGMYSPIAVAVDASGNLFVADYYRGCVRKVAPNGIITTVAGHGGNTFSGNGGPAIYAGISLPLGLAVDASGNLFIAEVLGGALGPESKHRRRHHCCGGQRSSRLLR